MRKPLAVILLLLRMAASGHAQDYVPPREKPLSWDAFVEAFTALAGDADDESPTDQQTLEDLYDIHCNKLNINDLHADELRSLPFLNHRQTVEMLDAMEQHRPAASMDVLASVPSVSLYTRRLLQLFCYVGPAAADRPTLANALRKSKNELILRTDIPLYTKAGHAHHPADELRRYPNRAYRGTPAYHSLRYSLATLGKLTAGVQMEKDAGERGIDYLSAYAMARRVGPVDALVVGDYRLSFGLGLVANNASAFGKSFALGLLSSMNRGIRQHATMQESGYFSGAAATLRLPRGWQASAYASRRNADGTLRPDSLGVSSLKTDGLHRTPLERSKKGNLGRTDLGCNLFWQRQYLRLAATAALTHFDTPLLPRHDTPSTRYRRYLPHGQDFGCYGLAYEYFGRGYHVKGETAASSSGGVATINVLHHFRGIHELTVVQRAYSARFVSINGRPFGENSSPQNEVGLYVGWKHRASRTLRVEGYIDGMYFPRPRHAASASSCGIDVMALAAHEGTRHATTLRYRLKSKQRDARSATNERGETEVLLSPNTVQSLRGQHVRILTDNLTLKTNLAAALVHAPRSKGKAGFGIGETVQWADTLHRRRSRHAGAFKAAASLIYFNTAGHSARLYFYEPSLLRTFGARAYHDHGMRAVLLASYPIAHRLDLIARFGHTRYFNRSTIGTGPELIPHSHRQDLELQARWQF